MNDYDTPEIRYSLRNLSRVTECLLDHMYILMHSIFHAMLFIVCMLKSQNVIVRLSLCNI